MNDMKLWIAFHHHAGEALDDWELYLEGRIAAKCESWAAIGSTCEFRAMHLTGVRSETMPGFKDKYLLKANLTPAEVAIVRYVASEQPLDNEADFWDGRIYCFEIINQLERDGVLDRDEKLYRKTRQLLRAKWKTGDGTIKCHSDGLEMWSREEDSSSDVEENDEVEIEIRIKHEIKVGDTVTTNRIHRSSIRAIMN